MIKYPLNLIDMLEQILQSEILQWFFSGIGCTIFGAFINSKYTNYQNRIQKIKCYYLEDEILLKIPMKDENDVIRNNIHCKKFKITNTANRDFDSLKIIFQFDPSACGSLYYADVHPDKGFYLAQDR